MVISIGLHFATTFCVTSKSLFDLLRTAAMKWSADKASRLGAALAYYSIFSLAPLLLVVTALTGIFLGGDDNARMQVIQKLSGIIGAEAARQIGEMAQAANQQSSGILISIIGVVVLLFGASGVFLQLQDSLNTIWKVTPKPGLGILALIRQRLLSLSIVFGAGFLLLVSLLLTVILKAVIGSISIYLPMAGTLQIVTFVVSFIITTLLFLMIYKVLPDVEIGWRDVGIGAVVTAVLFVIGQLALSWYLGTQSTKSAYGAAGSLVVLLLYIYYSAQILLFGAEITYVYANRFGTRIQPSTNAVSLEDTAPAAVIPRNKPLPQYLSTPQRRPQNDDTQDVLFVLLGFGLVALLHKWLKGISKNLVP